MTVIHCKLLWHSVSPHLQQLYTGFLMLHRRGAIHLSQNVRRTAIEYENDAPHLKDAGHAHLDATVNADTRLHFDTHDSAHIATGELLKCDFYFKRSYSPALVEALPADLRKKVFPLGLNYPVLPSVVDPFSMQRGLSLCGTVRARLSAMTQALDARNFLRYEPRLNAMEAPPDFVTNPKVLFFVAGYDPYDNPDREKAGVEDRILINEFRARCIRLLRRELGARFTGGFIPSRFTLDQYGDLVVPPRETSKEHYLKTLKSYPICLATTGLHGSTGWKLAEYVALARAIVSEPLLYRVPGNFECDRNYLEFTSADQCVDSTTRLLEDAGLCHELMRNNATYYQTHLRPDSLVWNALTTALEPQST